MTAAQDLPVCVDNLAQNLVTWVIISDYEELVIFHVISFVPDLSGNESWDSFRFPMTFIKEAGWVATSEKVVLQ